MRSVTTNLSMCPGTIGINHHCSCNSLKPEEKKKELGSIMLMYGFLKIWPTQINYLHYWFKYNSSFPIHQVVDKLYAYDSSPVIM